MAAKSTAASGNWSSTTVWGGSVPVDGDTVTINAAHTVVFDVDQSGFTNGLGGLVINGTLAFSTAASTTTVLKMNAGISGTGWLYMGNSEADPIPRSSSAMIDMPATNTQINPDNIRVYGWHPTARNHTTLSAGAALNATTVTLTDGLDVAAGEQVVIGCGNVNGVQTEGNKGVYTVQSYNAGTKTITLTAGLQIARLAGDVVAILTRRCVWKRRTAGDYSITTKANGVASGLWLWNTRSINGNSWVVSWSTGQNNANGGIGYYSHSSNFTYITGQNTTSGGVAALCLGANVQSCAVINCTNGIAAYGACAVSDCVTQNCSTGFAYYGPHQVFSSSAMNCTNGGLAFYGSGMTFKGCTSSGGPNGDLYQVQSAKLINCSLLSTTEFAGYNSAVRHPSNLVESIDHNGVSGAYKSWTRGGITTSVTTPVHDSAVRVYQMTPESATVPCWWQRRYQVPAGKAVTITAWLRKTVSMATLPTLQIFADGVEPLADAAAPIIYTWTMADSVDVWEKQVYQYTNTTDSDAIITCRFSCSGTTGYVYSDIMATIGGGVSRGRILGGM